MFEIKLYLGLPIDPKLEEALLKVPASLRSLLTGGGDYLCTFIHKESHYLGKNLPSFLMVDELERYELHLLSLLKKLAPTYVFSKSPSLIPLISPLSR